MADLMQQQNILRGLTDESLNAEMSSPTVPPFLVLTEISRRQAARERYEGDRARRGQPTTVVEDMTGKPPMQGVPAMGPPAMPSGSLPAPGQGMQAFADGGLVRHYATGGLISYDTIEQKLADQLNKFDSKKDRSRALALMMAGAAMMSNGSSNFMKNIGAGTATGAQFYNQSVGEVEDDESEAMRTALDFRRVRSADDLAQMEFEWRQRQAEAEAERQNRQLGISELGLVPSSVREAEWYEQATPEQKAAFDATNPAPSSSAMIGTGDDFRLVEENVRKAMTGGAFGSRPSDLAVTPEEKEAALTQEEKQIKVETYTRIRNAYGLTAALQYAAQAGLTDADIVTGATAATPASAGNDPLGIR